MKGLFGVMLIAAGIFVAVLGGFLFNAETVTTCETEWTYVTDIGGAFVGDDSDMDVEYDPPANMTGWTAFDEPNQGWISGVDYQFTDATNLYRVSTGERSYTSYTIKWSADDHEGNVSDPEYRIGVGSLRYIGTMEDGFGQHNPEAVTVFKYGSYTKYGSFAAPLTSLSAIVPGYDDLDVLDISVNSASSGYPCFAAVEKSISRGQYVHGSTYTPDLMTATATAYSTSVSIDVATGTASLGGQTVSLSSVIVVWGQAQFNGSGEFSHYFSTAGTGTLEAEKGYLDAASGFLLTQGTVTWNEMEYTNHTGSSSPSVSIAIEADSEECACQGSISYILPGSSASVEAATWWFAGDRTDGMLTLTPTGGAAFQLSTGPSAEIAMSTSSGVMTFTVDGEAAGSYDTGESSFGSIVLVFAEPETPAPFPSYTATVTRDDSSSESIEGSEAQTLTASLGYVTYSPTQHTESYTTTYWYNGRADSPVYNASISVLFKAIAKPTSCDVEFRGPDGSTTVSVAYLTDGSWTVDGVDMGVWDAMLVTVGYGKVTASPVSAFRTFLDYDLLGTSKEIVSSGAVGGGTVQSMAVSAGSTGVYMMKMCVVKTVTRIIEGGLFLQDASMSIQSAFPGEDAVSVMIGSAAAVGDSITFTSTYVSDGQTYTDGATIPVDVSKGVYIGGRWHSFNGTTFRWVSTGMASQTIAGETYAAAIYDRGKTYSAGAIWAQLRDGSMVKVIDTGDDWTMALDGIWAPSVFLYTGENEASQTTEIMDFTEAVYRWSAQDFILVMMGVSIAGGFLGSYFRVVDAWDWLAIIGTIGALWLFLG